MRWAVKPGGQELRAEPAGKRSRSLHVLATADSPQADPQDILSEIGIQLGAPFQNGAVFDPSVLCSRITARPNAANPAVWDIEYTYESRGADRDQQQSDPQDWEQPPLDRAPRLEFALAPRTESVEEAYLVGLSYWGANGRQSVEYKPEWMAITNSAGQRVDRPPTRSLSRLEMTYTRNEKRFPWDNALTYLDVTNEDKFLGQDPGLWLCLGITGSWVSEQLDSRTYGYWAVTYKFLFDPRGHDIEIMDEGTCENKNEGGTYKFRRAVDDNGIPSGKWPLNGSGGFLPKQQVQEGHFCYRIWRVYPRKPFAPLKITLPRLLMR